MGSLMANGVKGSLSRSLVNENNRCIPSTKPQLKFPVSNKTHVAYYGINPGVKQLFGFLKFIG
jgi:hypothetical protein